ncbi:MAG: anti-sigma factor antagonist [Clostridiales bacterium]|nr:anti-sigma factor antagonist [Clostridiales bacterium]
MFSYEISKEVLKIKIKGELDHSSAAPLKGRLDDIIRLGGYDMIVFDFSELQFMDSTGIGLLLGRYKTAKSISKPIAILKPAPPVDKVLKVSGIYSIMPKI